MLRHPNATFEMAISQEMEQGTVYVMQYSISYGHYGKVLIYPVMNYLLYFPQVNKLQRSNQDMLLYFAQF